MFADGVPQHEPDPPRTGPNAPDHADPLLYRARDILRVRGVGAARGNGASSRRHPADSLPAPRSLESTWSSDSSLSRSAPPGRSIQIAEGDGSSAIESSRRHELLLVRRVPNSREPALATGSDLWREEACCRSTENASSPRRPWCPSPKGFPHVVEELAARKNGTRTTSCATTPNTVRRWRARFGEQGVEGVGVIAKARGRKPWLAEGAVDRGGAGDS